MKYIKPFDNHFPAVGMALSHTIRDYMHGLIPTHGVGWANECVLLTLLDGAATIGALSGLGKRELVNYLTERYDARLEEATQHADGSLIIPRAPH